MEPGKGKRLTDASFKYTSSAATDVRSTFRRHRAKLKAAEAKAAAERLQQQPVQLRKVANGR